MLQSRAVQQHTSLVWRSQSVIFKFLLKSIVAAHVRSDVSIPIDRQIGLRYQATMFKVKFMLLMVFPAISSSFPPFEFTTTYPELLDKATSAKLSFLQEEDARTLRIRFGSHIILRPLLTFSKNKLQASSCGTSNLQRDPYMRVSPDENTSMHECVVGKEVFRS